MLEEHREQLDARASTINEKALSRLGFVSLGDPVKHQKYVDRRAAIQSGPQTGAELVMNYTGEWLGVLIACTGWGTDSTSCNKPPSHAEDTYRLQQSQIDPRLQPNKNHKLLELLPKARPALLECSS